MLQSQLRIGTKVEPRPASQKVSLPPHDFLPESLLSADFVEEVGLKVGGVRDSVLMGQQGEDQAKLFYEFCLEDRVPADHMLRKIERLLDLGAFVIAAVVLGATPSLALDCNQATSEEEKAICASPAAFAADAAMNKACGALRAMLDPAQRAALAKAQVGWLGQRHGACFDKHGADLGTCLADETGKRSRFLNAAPETGPGYSGKLVPFFRMEKGGKGKTDVDVQGFRFAAPASGAQRAFNAAVYNRSATSGSPRRATTRILMPSGWR